MQAKPKTSCDLVDYSQFLVFSNRADPFIVLRLRQLLCDGNLGLIILLVNRLT